MNKMKTTRENAGPRKAELLRKITGLNFKLRTDPIKKSLDEQERLFDLTVQNEAQFAELIPRAIAEGLFPDYIMNLWLTLVEVAEEDSKLNIHELNEKYPISRPFADFIENDSNPHMVVFFLDALLPRWNAVQGIYSILTDRLKKKDIPAVDDGLKHKFFRLWIDKITNDTTREELLLLNSKAKENYLKYQKSVEEVKRQHENLPWTLPSPPVMLLGFSPGQSGESRICAYDPSRRLLQASSFLQTMLDNNRFLNIKIDLHYDKKEILKAIGTSIDGAQRITGKNPSKGRIDALTMAVRELIEVYLIKYYVEEGLSKEDALEEISERLDEIGKHITAGGIKKRHIKPIISKYGASDLEEYRQLKTKNPTPLPIDL